MDKITGLIGRDELVATVVAEIKKGKHVILTGPVGVGKSAVLRAALEKIEGKRLQDQSVLLALNDHQAKGQFVEMARQMLELGVLTPSALGLPAKFHETEVEEFDWAEVRNQVNRMSIRDLTHAIIPALAHSGKRVVIAVDDLTALTPTQMAFWLAIFNHAQVIGCASEKKARVKKLWWKMREIEIKPLPPDAVREIVTRYITEKGVLVESPELYISHLIKQAGGIPQAIHDMLDQSSKERIIDKRKVREMQHEAGVRYLDFSPVLIIVGALIVSLRYVGMGTGDKILYMISGISAAIFISLRFFVFKGSGK